jgi:hypothetical protein
VQEGFTSGEKLCVSSLTYAVEGAKVEIIATPVDAASEKNEESVAPKS